jgi:hypothetical protein
MARTEAPPKVGVVRRTVYAKHQALVSGALKQGAAADALIVRMGHHHHHAVEKFIQWLCGRDQRLRHAS